MTTPPPLLSQPLPFRLLLDEAVREARGHFRHIFPSVAIPLMLVGGALPLAQTVFFQQAMDPAHAADPASMVFGFGTFIVALLVFWFVYALAYGAMIAAAVDAVARRPVSMRRAWALMVRPRVFGTMLLVGVIVIAGMMCCVLPGLYAGLLFSLAIPVMVEEGAHGTSALRRSAELARYNPQRQLDEDPRFKVFLVFLVGTLLGYTVNMLVQLPAVAAQQFLMFREAAGGKPMDPAQMMAKLTWLQVPTSMLGMATNAAVHLYVCFGLALLFFDVKGRKEGLDLESAVARLVQSRGLVPLP